MENIEPEILKKYESIIWNNINKINSIRVKNVSVIICLITLLVIIGDLIDYKNGLWTINHGYVLLFFTHVFYVLMLSALILLFYFIKIKNNRFNKYFSLFFAGYLLNLSAFLSGWVEQMLHIQITVYIIACFAIAGSFYFERKYVILLYGQSYVFFLVYLSITQVDKEIAKASFVNSFLVIVLSCFMSITISRLTQKEYVHKYHLQELVKTRSDSLVIQQQAINRLQQFNVIGELSAGIAHEIRNPLTSVRGFLQLLGNKDYNKKDKEYFDLMIEELDRANSIITEFLGLTKDKKVNFDMKDLNHLILKLIPLIDTDSSYQIKTDLGDIPELRLDDKEICQVILNLANNGCESMPQGGSLTIKTYQSNDNVILEIQDQGSGINPEILEKLGTPFFTTKDKGTGLGLAVCSSIISQHNAKLDIKSGANGSTFRVLFNIHNNTHRT